MKGFTLIEVMIVVAIIAILTVVALSSYQEFKAEQAEQTRQENTVIYQDKAAIQRDVEAAKQELIINNGG